MPRRKLPPPPVDYAELAFGCAVYVPDADRWLESTFTMHKFTIDGAAFYSGATAEEARKILIREAAEVGLTADPASFRASYRDTGAILDVSGMPPYQP